MHLEIGTPGNFSFVETLNAHGWRRLAPFDVDDNTSTLRRAEQLANGKVVLLTMRAGDSSIQIDVDAEADAAEIINCVRAMFQLDVPIDRFHSYCAAESALAHIPHKKAGTHALLAHSVGGLLQGDPHHQYNLGPNRWHDEEVGGFLRK